MQAFPDVPRNRLGSFTTHEARLAGWTKAGLDHAVLTGRLQRVAVGWYVPAPSWNGAEPADVRRRLALRTIAALGSIRGSVASSASAAVLAGLPVWTTPERPCVTVPPGGVASARSAHVHRAQLPGDQIAGGRQPRTSAARTVVDVAREHGALEAVVLGDAALEDRRTDPRRLAAALASVRGRPGAQAAAHALALLDGRAESPAESVSRLRFIEWGTPTPDLQTAITDLRGVEIGRVDFYWDEFGVAGEVDGRLKYRDRPDAAFFREKRRQERLEDTGLIVVRWGVADLTGDTDLPRRLLAAFVRGRQRSSDRRWLTRPTPPRTVCARQGG